MFFLSIDMRALIRLAENLTQHKERQQHIPFYSQSFSLIETVHISLVLLERVLVL